MSGINRRDRHSNRGNTFLPKISGPAISGPAISGPANSGPANIGPANIDPANIGRNSLIRRLSIRIGRRRVFARWARGRISYKQGTIFM
jgi:hypothetical protein